jgi:glycosyltransferase involved in cell wall biosynthesis
MLILLDCRPLLADHVNGEKSRFIFACADCLSRRYGVAWFYLVDKSYRGNFPGSVSSNRVLTRKTLPGLAGWMIWYDWQVSAAAKNCHADLIMTTGGISASRANKPQCLWMPERADPAKQSTADGLNKHIGSGFAGLYRRRLPRSLKESGTIFSFSEKDKIFLTQKMTDGFEKIMVLRGAADRRYIPLPVEEQQQIKRAHADGKEYLLTVVSGARPEELIDLLKAFSLFKERQHSNMRLVLAGAGAVKAAARMGLDSYKYRSSVRVFDGVEEELLTRLVAASYAMIVPFRRDDLGIAVLNAWKTGTPVIAIAGTLVAGTRSDAVLSVDPGDPGSLAGQMMRIYKDEKLRGGLIGKGTLQLTAFDLERAAAGVWDGILRAKS